MADNKSNMQIAVQYQLPEKWNEETAFSFEHLSDLVEQVHTSAYSASVKAINRFATVRNYVIGYYIVEYEQHGSDRAKYGDKLLKRLAEKVNKRGINETLLKISRAFYLNYPQVKTYLEGKSATLSHQLNKKSAMPSHQLEKIKTESEKSIELLPTLSGKFITPADELISRLSFSHIREIMTKENEMNEGDNPPIGILLCTRKGEKMVEYALAGMDNNLFVSTYMLSLPDKKTLQDFLLRETQNK